MPPACSFRVAQFHCIGRFRGRLFGCDARCEVGVVCYMQINLLDVILDHLLDTELI
jgi:hypothetical protein